MAAWKKLFSRAHDGDANEVRDILEGSGGGAEAVVALSNPKTGDNVLHALCRDGGGLDMFVFIVDLCGQAEGQVAVAGLGNFDGKTPLHEAAQCKNEFVVSYLLQKVGIRIEILYSRLGKFLAAVCKTAMPKCVV